MLLHFCLVFLTCFWFCGHHFGFDVCLLLYFGFFPPSVMFWLFLFYLFIYFMCVFVNVVLYFCFCCHVFWFCRCIFVCVICCCTFVFVNLLLYFWFCRLVFFLFVCFAVRLCLFSCFSFDTFWFALALLVCIYPSQATTMNVICTVNHH